MSEQTNCSNILIYLMSCALNETIPEDFYVFILAHAFKHYSHSGTGIRTLADIYVMYRRMQDSLNWDYVDRELEELGILEYARKSRRLAEKIFGQPGLYWDIPLTDEEEKMLSYHLEATTYGTIENKVKHHLHSQQGNEAPVRLGTKHKYFFSRLFPGRDWCRIYYPFVYRHSWILPAFWVWRIIFRGTAKRKMVKEEIASLKSCK